MKRFACVLLCFICFFALTTNALAVTKTCPQCKALVSCVTSCANSADGATDLSHGSGTVKCTYRTNNFNTKFRCTKAHIFLLGIHGHYENTHKLCGVIGHKVCPF